MNKTSIEWTDYTWNPVTGCHKVSQGCKNCYAETMTNRFGKSWGVESFRQVLCHDDRLMEPCHMGDKLHGKKVFVCDMSDLFHEQVPVRFIADVFETIWNCPDTIFQILTKRPERALKLMDEISDRILVDLPLKNVWLGVSCEDQATADQRIPLLMKIPAAFRFLSCEPLLGPIDLTRIAPFLGGCFAPLKPHPCTSPGKPFIDWVICGGESGHHARPMHPDWARSLRDQCTTAGVPFFFKQWGKYLHESQGADGHGGRWISIMDSDSKAEYKYKNIGKRESGNFLDGKQHLEFPNVITRP